MEEDLIALEKQSATPSLRNSEIPASDEVKPQQSYLALTKLGMGKKKPEDAEAEASGKKSSPKESKKAQTPTLFGKMVRSSKH